MADRKFVAFDLGAESGRALLGRLSDGKLELQEKHRFANPVGRVNGHLYWNLLSQWEELKAGLRKCASEGTIDGLGVDTWGVDYGLIDEHGNVLGNPYHYRDSRTDDVMEAAFEQVRRERIFETTGVQFMQFNTLFQLLAHHEEQPKLLECADRLLFMPDLFNFLFTGVARNERCIASTSQMFDPRKNAWATEMLTELGLPTHLLGEIVPPGTVLGELKQDVQEECGVGPIRVIAPGTHDTASAVASVPVGEDSGSWCYISSGTWSLLGVELPEPLINAATLQHSYTNEGGVGGSTRLLRNIMGLWLVQECRRYWQSQGEDLGYAELTRMAAEARSMGSLVDPDSRPFLSPGQMPEKIAAFCQRTGQPVPSTKGEVVRTCLESLALAYRQAVEGLETVLGRKIEVIHIVGGGTQNELLSQMTADACGRLVIAGPVEATSIGNILVQAMAVGEVADLAEARRIVRASFPVKRYEPRERAQWDEAYARYRKIVGR